jgi:rhomboid protease GluP
VSPEDDPPPRYGPPAWGPPPEALPPTEPPAPPQPTVWDRFRTRFEEGPVSVSIVVVTVAVWLVHLALQHWAGVNTDLTLGDPGTAIHGQLWRFLTPLVVHFGVLHIGLNMLALWQIGPPVEKVIGRWLYLSSYLICGAAGQVVSDLYYQWHPAHRGGQTVQVLAGGASGAIFGVIGLLIGNHVVTDQLEKRGHRSTQAWRFRPAAARSLAIQGALCIGFTSIAIPGIDNWAHLGGVAAGLVIGGVVAWARTRPVVVG